MEEETARRGSSMATKTHPKICPKEISYQCFLVGFQGYLSFLWGHGGIYWDLWMGIDLFSWGMGGEPLCVARQMYKYDD